MPTSIRFRKVRNEERWIARLPEGSIHLIRGDNQGLWYITFQNKEEDYSEDFVVEMQSGPEPRVAQKAARMFLADLISIMLSPYRNLRDFLLAEGS